MAVQTATKTAPEGAHTDVHTDVHTYQSVTLRGLWWSLAAGAVLWSLHLVVSYALLSLACERGLFTVHLLPGIAAVRLIVGTFTLIAALLVLYAGLVAYRNWRHMRRADSSAETEPAGRFRFMALLGALLNSIFFATIFVTAFPIIFMQLCD